MSTRKPPQPAAASVRPCTTPACRRMKTLFADWHDHVLHWRTRRTLEAHLTACSPCRVYFESLEQTIVIVRAWPGVDVPAPVRGHLRELLLEHHARKRAAAPAAPGSRASARAARARKR